MAGLKAANSKTWGPQIGRLEHDAFATQAAVSSHNTAVQLAPAKERKKTTRRSVFSDSIESCKRECTEASELLATSMPRVVFLVAIGTLGPYPAGSIPRSLAQFLYGNTHRLLHSW